MNSYFLFLILFIIGLISSILNKNFQKSFRMNTENFIHYNFINALIASSIFLITSKFNITVTLPTLIFALIFALIVAVVLINNLYVLSKISISLSSIISTAGSATTSILFGILIFNEKPSFSMISSMLLMVTAVALPIIMQKQNSQISTKGHIGFYLFNFLLAGSSNILLKIYTQTPGVSDSTSFYFLTNVIICVLCGIYIFFKRIKCKQKINPFNYGQLLNIGIRTLFSNISSLITILILNTMDITIYTVLSSSTGLICSFVVSSLYFKEPQPLSNKLALLISILAILVRELINI